MQCRRGGRSDYLVHPQTGRAALEFTHEMLGFGPVLAMTVQGRVDGTTCAAILQVPQAFAVAGRYRSTVPGRLNMHTGARSLAV